MGFGDTGTQTALRLGLADVGAPFKNELALKDLGEKK
jgi:hypothetical protein